MAGLEGPLVAALLLAAILLHLHERETVGVPFSGLLWGLIALTRPDGILFFAITLAFKCGDGLLAAGRVAEEDRSVNRREALRFAAWIAMFAALYVPYFVWRYSYYGWLFPNTFYTKVGPGLDEYNRGLQYLSDFSREYGAALILLVPAAAAFTQIRRIPVAYVASLLVGWSVYVTYIGGDSLSRFRFFQPVLPIFYALIAASGAALFVSLRPSTTVGAPLRATMLALLVGAAITYTILPSANGIGASSLRYETAQLEARQIIGSWLRQEVPDTTLVAVIAAGTMPYTSERPSLDMLGLNDEHIAHAPFPQFRSGAGHEKYDSTYVLDRKPQIIIVYDSLTADPLGARAYQFAAVSTVLIPAVVDLALNPRLLTEYEPRAVQLASGLWFNLLVRRDAGAVLRRTAPVP